MNRDKFFKKKQNVWQLLGALILISLSVWKISKGLEQNMDIRFYDESFYLTQGLFQNISDWIPDYSPLYCLHYKILGVLFPDGIELYYANYRFWDLVLGISIYALLRKAGIAYVPAILWGMSACASQLGLPLWPKAGHLAMTATSIGIAGIWFWRGQLKTQLIWITGICLCISWCRPEFLAGALTAGLLLIYFIWKGEGTIGKPAFIPLLLALIFALIWGLPFGESGRGLVAFGQHFVHNWRNISGQNSGDLMWDWVNWRPIFEQHFSSAKNPLEAFFTNPADMLQHLWFNLRYLFYNSLVYFSETLFPKRLYGISPLIGFGLLWLGAEILQGFELGEKFLKKLKDQNTSSFLPWFCLAIPSLLAGLLFQPRPHYILPLLPFFVFGAGLFLRNITLSKSLKSWRPALIQLPFILLFFLPDCQAFFQIVSESPTSNKATHPEKEELFGPVTAKSLAHKTLIQELEKYPFQKDFRIFDASTGATEYLGKKVIQCGKTGFEMNYQTLANFPHFLDSAKVQGIFLHETIRYDRFFSSNVHWQKLKSQPQNMGWLKIPIGKAGDSLLVRN